MRDAEQSLNLSTGTVELELPMLGADTRAQDWRLAKAGRDSRAATSAMRTGSRSPTFGADTAFFQDSIAYANGGARRPQGSQLPWMAQHHQLARAEVAHEFELPDLRTPRPVPAQAPRGGGAGKSGGCACGGKCGGRCSNKGAAVHGASASNPWPLDDARHNLVLLAQELLLLEGHLADPERRCPSCVTKHALTVRGLADEGRRLDTTKAFDVHWSRCTQLGASASVHDVIRARRSVIAELLPNHGGPSGHTAHRPDSTPTGQAAYGLVTAEVRPTPMSQVQFATGPQYAAGGKSPPWPPPNWPTVLPKLPIPEILDWLKSLPCKAACLGKSCGSVGGCNCGSCPGGNCIDGKCCGPFECCKGNCKGKPGMTVGQQLEQEGKLWGCDKLRQRCICGDGADDCRGDAGCSCPPGTSCKTYCAVAYENPDKNGYIEECSDAAYQTLLENGPTYKFQVTRYGKCEPPPSLNPCKPGDKGCNA